MYHLVNKMGNPKDFYMIVKEKKKEMMRPTKGLPLFLCSVHALHQCSLKSSCKMSPLIDTE